MRPSTRTSLGQRMRAATDGHRRERLGDRERRRPARAAAPVAGGPARAQQHGDEQALRRARPTSRGRGGRGPPVWCRAVTTVPSGAPAAASRAGLGLGGVDRRRARGRASADARGGLRRSPERGEARGELRADRRCSPSRSRSRSTTSAGARSTKSGRAELALEEGDLLARPLDLLARAAARSAARSTTPCQVARTRRRSRRRHGAELARAAPHRGSTVIAARASAADQRRGCSRATAAASVRRARTVTASSTAGEIRLSLRMVRIALTTSMHRRPSARSASAIAPLARRPWGRARS